MGDNFLQFENQCIEIMCALQEGNGILLAMPVDNMRQREDTDTF